MISAADFKKHISKTLSEQLKGFGFKGSGFNYLMDSDYFVFTIGIQASQYGGQCCAEFGIQPKSVDTNGFEKLDFKKLKYYNCEFRTRLSPKEQGDYWWKYSDLEQKNIQIALEIAKVVKTQVIPVIDYFKSDKNILEKIEVSDLENMYLKLPKKLGGMSFGTTDIRMAWTLVRALEETNLPKAKEFAEYALSKLGKSSTFVGVDYLNSIMIKNNGA